jgi:peroxiredoxin
VASPAEGSSPALWLVLLAMLVIGFLVWWFEFREGPSQASTTNDPGLGVQPLDDSLNPTGRAPGGDRGRAAPNFRLATFDGQSITLASFRGKWVLLNFWASWCGPCRSETPALQSLWEDFQEEPFAIIGINQQESLEIARAFTEEFGVTYPVVLDRDGDVSIAYRVGSGLPISMLVNPEGVIERIIIGALTPEDFTSIRRDVQAE